MRGIKFRRILLAIGLLALVQVPVSAEVLCRMPEVLPDNSFPSVKFETSQGDIVVELNRSRAPLTVNNFLRYVIDGHYDNTVFHRVIANFVVQGGGYDATFAERKPRAAIYNESGNGLKNKPGTIAMARYDDPHSAKAQFFFNLADNDSLDPGRRNWGYTVFGQVIEGMQVVEKIATMETAYNDKLDATDVPLETVVVKKAVVLETP